MRAQLPHCRVWLVSVMLCILAGIALFVIL